MPLNENVIGRIHETENTQILIKIELKAKMTILSWISGSSFIGDSTV
jgi:hypothetical protein